MVRFALPVLIALLFAGCGGDEAAAPPEDDPPPVSAEVGDPVAVSALGDSITSGSPLYDPDPEARSALGFGDDEESQYEYWAEQEKPALQFKNCGVFGERTDQIAQRLPGCAEGADILIVQGGINDIAQGLGSGPGAISKATRSAAANIDAMLAEAEEMGLDAAVANVLPWNNGHPVADDPIKRLNAEIAEIATKRGVPLLDFHDALENPNLRGTMSPEYTDDGDHPSIEGYRVLGELVADELG